MDKFLDTIDNLDKPKDCRGLHYRGYRSVYINDIGVHVRQGINLLKKLSCQGCPKCEGTKDFIEETVSYDGAGFHIPAIKDGALYTVRIRTTSIDLDTGYADDWDIIIEEEKPTKSQPN